MIPKLIHYCWFGSRNLSDLEQSCIESWKNILPEYSFKCWNEGIFEIKSFDFANEAYRLGKYAFVSDVCRFYALYEEGGIYLDTDMMVIKSFNDLLSIDCFIGEQKEKSINAAIIGAKPKHPLIKELLEGYRFLKFDYHNPLDIPAYLNFSLDSDRISVFTKDYFYPLPFSERKRHFRDYITKETYAVHLWNHSWKNEWDYLHEKNFKLAFQTYFHRLVSSPKTFLKDPFLLDFIKFFLADKFKLLYRIYKIIF